MKNFIRLCVVIILSLLLRYTLVAQERSVILEPNRNSQAKGLIHTLNQTKDTLILQSEKMINRLYSIHKSDGREFDILVNASTYQFPLKELTEGKHVLVVVQSPVKIVFVIQISNKNPTDEPFKMNTKEAVAIKSTF